MPVAWTAVELIRTYFPIGFPWNLLGYTAYHNLELIQFAEFTGVYGVSALIVFFNAVMYVVISAAAVLASGCQPERADRVDDRAGRIRRVANPRSQEPPSAGSFKVAMVQGNIPQSLKWDPNFLSQSYKVYQDETVDAAKHGTDLIVWPEAAAAFLFQPDDRYPAMLASDVQYRTTLLTLARNIGKPILFGAPALAVQNDRVAGFYNRAYLVSDHGEVVAYYDKIELVPFGEYVPARALLGFFVNRIVEGMGDMIPGKQQTLFEVKGAKLGILICYESIFPDFTRREVNEGADILVNITNDAWYGESSAPYQVLAMAVMRSIETKVPMVRVANTGFSATIEPSGQITNPRRCSSAARR